MIATPGENPGILKLMLERTFKVLCHGKIMFIKHCFVKLIKMLSIQVLFTHVTDVSREINWNLLIIPSH